jgi:hypothetical protein
MPSSRREVTAVQGVLLLLDGEQQLQGGRVDVLEEASTISEQTYVLQTPITLVAELVIGLHLNESIAT